MPPAIRNARAVHHRLVSGANPAAASVNQVTNATKVEINTTSTYGHGFFRHSPHSFIRYSPSNGPTFYASTLIDGGACAHWQTSTYRSLTRGRIANHYRSGKRSVTLNWRLPRVKKQPGSRLAKILFQYARLIFRIFEYSVFINIQVLIFSYQEIAALYDSPIPLRE